MEVIDGHGVSEEGVGTDWGDSVRVGISMMVSGSGANLIRRVGVGTLALR